MAMIKCPECGNEISTRATACVKCGLPMSEIFVCPECSNVMVKKENSACTNCGCPFDSNSKTISNETKEKKQEKNEQSEEEYIVIAEKIITSVLAKFPVSGTGIICSSGKPITDVKKVNDVKISFNIPKNDNVFLIVSGNFFSGINETCKGFALTSHGLFFKDDSSKVDYFLLHELANIKISKSLGYLKIGSFNFNLGTPGTLCDLLLRLQNEIGKYV